VLDRLIDTITAIDPDRPLQADVPHAADLLDEIVSEPGAMR
jgi:hypothetical protein